MSHSTILKNLLFSEKDNKIILNFSDSKDKNIFSSNSFILNYSSKAIKKIFEKNFDKDDSTKLYNIYLYLIFRVKEPDFIIKLKIFIYFHLYNKNDVGEFIRKISIPIKENYNKKTLIEQEKNWNEIDNFTINIVTENVDSFFNGKKEDITGLFNFFTIDNIKRNFTKKYWQERHCC